MTPQPLNRPFIGITISKDDYSKVKGLLPTPSYQDTLYSHVNQKIELIYEIDTFHFSSKEYKFMSDIKIGMKKFFFVPIIFIDDFSLSDNTEISGATYSLIELSNAFKCQYISYPLIHFPSTKKELYKYLVRHGKKLRYQRLFTKEALIATALLMNDYLSDKLIIKEVHKKALGAYKFIIENSENFKEKLTKSQLQKAHSMGGKRRKSTQAQNTIARINELLKTNDYIKPNGKVNKTALAKAMGMNRRTLDKYL